MAGEFDDLKERLDAITREMKAREEEVGFEQMAEEFAQRAHDQLDRMANELRLERMAANGGIDIPEY